MGYLCEKCGKTKNDNQFYTYRNGDKVEMCKDCLTMHVNNFEPDTFLWILQKLDVPYIETE
jgi:Zn-finger protein